MQEKNTRDETVVITGAFGCTGKYATKLLLNRGYKVRTLQDARIRLATGWKFFLTLSIVPND